MKELIIKAVIKYILPFIVIIFAFSNNSLAGLALLLLYIVIMLYIGRANLFSFIGNMKYSSSSLDQALIWFKRSSDTKKATMRTLISYAYILLKTGSPDEAGQLLEDLLKKKPNKETELYIKANLALVYWKKSRLDDAVSTLQEVISEYKTTTVYGSLGYLLMMQGDIDKALDFNLEAYDFNNTNSIILDNLAQNYFLKGMYEESQQTYDKLLAQNPTFPEAYYNYSLLLIEQGQTDKAVEMLNKALGCKFSFLSDISKEKITVKLEELESAQGT